MPAAGAILGSFVLMVALWIFIPLFVNILFVALFHKKINRLLTISVGFVGGIAGAKLWVELFGPALGPGDPGYIVISSLVTCLFSAGSISFVQVIRQLPQDNVDGSAQNNINEQSENPLTPNPSPARGGGSKQ